MLNVENELYTIQISDREEGYYTCTYKILDDEVVLLVETSGKKILQRLSYVFSLYSSELTEDQSAKILADLKSIAKELKIMEDFIENLLKKYRIF